jgi:hypothetical protein
MLLNFDPSTFGSSILGTSLERLVNTSTIVFKEPTDDELYVLVTDHWFRAWTTDGPWQFVPAERLPSDIARQVALKGSQK